MKVCFDQNVPYNLLPFLATHEVRTARQMGWDELGNGDLLKAAESHGFGVFLTCDQELTYQQNLPLRSIAIVEITKNNWPSIEPHVHAIADGIQKATPGSYQVIDCPYVHRARIKRVEDAI